MMSLSENAGSSCGVAVAGQREQPLQPVVGQAGHRDPCGERQVALVGDVPHERTQPVGKRMLGVARVQKLLGELAEPNDLLGVHGEDQLRPCSEMPVEGRVGDTSGPGKLVKRDLRTVLIEHTTGGSEQRRMN